MNGTQPSRFPSNPTAEKKWNNLCLLPNVSSSFGRFMNRATDAIHKPAKKNKKQKTKKTKKQEAIS